MVACFFLIDWCMTVMIVNGGYVCHNVNCGGEAMCICHFYF